MSVVKNQWPRLTSRLKPCCPGELPHFPDVAPAVPRAEHEGRAPADERFEQAVVIFKVVFQVGILDQQIVAGGGFQSGSHGVAFSARLIFENQFHSRMIFIFQGKFAGAVGRVAFHDDDFYLKIRQFVFAGEFPSARRMFSLRCTPEQSRKASGCGAACAFREKTMIPLAAIRRCRSCTLLGRNAGDEIQKWRRKRNGKTVEVHFHIIEVENFPAGFDDDIVKAGFEKRGLEPGGRNMSGVRA
jgi:hypothetical protein